MTSWWTDAMPTISIRDYLYLAAILVLTIGAIMFVHHERSEGAAKVLAADAKAAQLQRQRDDALQVTAALATSTANGDYTREIAIPVHDAPVPVRLCDAPRPEPVSEAAASAASGDVAPERGSEDASATPELQRFADEAVTIARDDDAQVAALQKIITDLRTEMQGVQ
jgi:hypothetical protein